MRTGLTARVLLAAGALIVIAVAVLVSLLVATVNANQARTSTQHNQQEIILVRELRNSLIDLETGQRGFIITGDARFLEPWEAARRSLPGQLSDLRQLTEGPGQAGRAEQLQRNSLSYLDDYSIPLVDEARHTNPSARSLVASQDGKRLMDGLRREMDTYNADEMLQNLAAQSRADRAYRRAGVLAGAGLGVLVITTALTAAYLARSVVGPVRRTSVMAERIAAGDLAARVQETGPGEIGVLKGAFNSMAESLQRNRDELDALRRIATLVAQGTPPHEVFGAVTSEVGTLLGADITRLLRFEPDGTGTVVAAWSQTGDPVAVGKRIAVDGTVAARVHQSGKPARITEQSPPELPEGSYSAVGAAVTVGGTLWGAVTALSPQDRPLPDASDARMAKFTDLVGTAIANAQDRADLVASRARIVTAADDARRRLERDLHDGAQQQIVSLALQARMAQDSAPLELKDEFAQLVSSLTNISGELREISRGLHPGILSEGGLGPALKALARRSHLPISVDLHIDEKLSEAVEVAAYYVAAEALTNIAKHAHASQVAVHAETRDDVLCLQIEDNGIGGADFRRGTGLVGLRDRVEAFGGHMALISPPGGGTSITVNIPFSAQALLPMAETHL